MSEDRTDYTTTAAPATEPDAPGLVAKLRDWAQHYANSAQELDKAGNERLACYNHGQSDAMRMAASIAEKPELQWQHERETLRSDLAQARAEAHALHRERIGEVWYWQGDGQDHLESLTCPILIEVADLDALLQHMECVKALEAGIARVADELRAEDERCMVIQDGIKYETSPAVWDEMNGRAGACEDAADRLAALLAPASAEQEPPPATDS